MNADVVKGLKKRYKNIHPLIFHRSCEKARSDGELFDILDTFDNSKYPQIWDDEQRRWVHTDDLFQSMRFYQ